MAGSTRRRYWFTTRATNRLKDAWLWSIDSLWIVSLTGVSKVLVSTGILFVGLCASLFGVIQKEGGLGLSLGVAVTVVVVVVVVVVVCCETEFTVCLMCVDRDILLFWRGTFSGNTCRSH
jgi:hypothetical protein